MRESKTKKKTTNAKIKKTGGKGLGTKDIKNKRNSRAKAGVGKAAGPRAEDTAPAAPEAGEGNESAPQAKQLSVLGELKEFEAVHERKLANAQKNAEKKVADASKEIEARVKKERESLEKQRQALINEAKKEGMKEAEAIIKEYKNEIEKLRQVQKKNLDAAINAVVDAMLCKGA